VSVPHTALVTGASRGIGAAIASALSDRGVTVLSPRRQDLDLLSSDSIRAFVARHRNAGIDILVNNAGINILNAIEAVRPEDWQAMLQVNLTAPALLAQGLAADMRARRWGRIVNVSSVFSQIAKEKRAAYCASKAGLDGLTRTLAVELGPDGILVNSIAPGYVDTELTQQNNSPQNLAKITRTIPLRRLAQPHEIARLIAFLCSEDNTYLTGQTLVIDGGLICQ